MGIDDDNDDLGAPLAPARFPGKKGARSKPSDEVRGETSTVEEGLEDDAFVGAEEDEEEEETGPGWLKRLARDPPAAGAPPPALGLE